MRPQAEALSLAALQAQRGFDRMVTDYDQRVARKKLGALAIRCEEMTFDTLQLLRPMYDDPFALQQRRKFLDLRFDPSRAFSIDLDQVPSGMRLKDRRGRRGEPSLRLFVEKDDLTSRCETHDRLVQTVPLMVYAAHGHAEALGMAWPASFSWRRLRASFSTAATREGMCAAIS